MALDRILLSNFRNHRDTALLGAAQFNLLVGENGAGKTNVLEALSLFAPGRGLRHATLNEMMAQCGPGSFAISADLCSDQALLRLGTGNMVDRPKRRIVQINQAEAPAIRLGEWLSIGWLTPAMDRLFSDGAAARRRFMDRMVLALSPDHAGNASRLEVALRERNRLLSDDSPPDPAWLDAIEMQIAEAGALVASARQDLVISLHHALAVLPSSPFACPALEYMPGGPIKQGDLANALKDNRPRDRAAKRSLIGPHRDELRVVMTGKNQPAADCSTGEQKAMLIAITLAHAELLESDRPRILLLDEVAAHLDPVRRKAMFDRLREGGAQVWLTGTETAPFSDIIQEAAIWTVEGGAVQKTNL